MTVSLKRPLTHKEAVETYFADLFLAMAMFACADSDPQDSLAQDSTQKKSLFQRTKSFASEHKTEITAGAVITAGIVAANSNKRLDIEVEYNLMKASVSSCGSGNSIERKCARQIEKFESSLSESEIRCAMNSCPLN